VQIEYALKAVSGGSTSLGIVATDGVVIATEKKMASLLVDETTVQKISMLSPNIGVVYSGMGPDYRVLVRKARKTAQAYYALYKEHIPVAQLVREVAAVMQEFTRKWCCPCTLATSNLKMCTQLSNWGTWCVAVQSRVVCAPLECPSCWQGLMTMGHSCIRLIPQVGVRWAGQHRACQLCHKCTRKRRSSGDLLRQAVNW
jgi:hypothetical protein